MTTKTKTNIAWNWDVQNGLLEVPSIGISICADTYQDALAALRLCLTARGAA